MSRRASREAVAAQMAEERRLRLHSDLAQLITDARGKLDAYEVLIPAYWKMSIQDMTEFVDTDTGRTERARHQRIEETLVRVGLGVGDGPLRAALGSFEKCFNQWADEAMGPVTDRKRKNDFEAVREGMAHLRATRRALNAVQAQAIQALAVPVTVAAPPSLLSRAVAWVRTRRNRAAPLT